MSRSISIVLLLALVSLFFGVWHGIQTLPNVERQNSIVPAFEETQINEWKSRIEGFAQFKPLTPIITQSEEENAQKPEQKSDIESAKLVGIFIEQNASAIIISGDAPTANAKRYRIGEQFDEKWRLTAIDTTSITLQNESDGENFVMYLFDPARPIN